MLDTNKDLRSIYLRKALCF